MKKYLLAHLMFLYCFSSFANQEELSQKVHIFDYHSLASNRTDIVKHLHQYGFIAVRNVPGFEKAYQNYLNVAKKFVTADESVKQRCSPDNSFSRGWSYGIETFNGQTDAQKGSYYVAIGDQVESIRPNVWPPTSWKHADVFKTSYLNLANLIYNTGKEILPLLDLKFSKLSATGRLLYYAPASKESKKINPNWCGQHRDHGLFTGLTPATYIKNGITVVKPAGSGLYIQGRPVTLPSDVMLFQVGEAAHIMTNGRITATKHHVKKAFDGHERYAMAVFFGIDESHKMTSTVTEYNDRFINNMTYNQWCTASYNRYKS